MAHHSRIDKIVIDVPTGSHDAEVAFWQGAVGKELQHFQRFPEYHGVELHGIGLLTQKLGEGEARVHIDIHTDDVEAEVARLEKLGATREHTVNGWWIMRDPAGLPFCVIGDPPGRLTDENATRWD